MPADVQKIVRHLVFRYYLFFIFTTKKKRHAKHRFIRHRHITNKSEVSDHKARMSGKIQTSKTCAVILFCHTDKTYKNLQLLVCHRCIICISPLRHDLYRFFSESTASVFSSTSGYNQSLKLKLGKSAHKISAFKSAADKLIIGYNPILRYF